MNLKPYNTFHISCEAKAFVSITSTEQLQTMIAEPSFNNTKILILGGGSNILLTTDSYDGLVLKNDIIGKEILSEDEKSVTIRVGGGENRDEFVWRSIEQGYCGLENLVSIPGTVGASPIQNIGAYGVEAGEYIQEVEYVSLASITSEGEIIHGIQSVSTKECRFGYRNSIFKQELKGTFFITHVLFRLSKYTHASYTPVMSYGAIAEKIQENELVTPRLLASIIAEIRASKLPDWTKIGTAGSFFKNPYVSQSVFEDLQKKYPELRGRPVKLPSSKGTKSGGENHTKTALVKLSAGQLIDMAGCKGLRVGDAGTYEKHALVLVNHGTATGADIVQVAEYIQEKVSDMFGLEIVPEVNWV